MSAAVITLTRNRTSHLVNLVRGLVRSSTRPDRLVVAVMGGEDPRPAIPDAPFAVRWVTLDVGSDDPLPLAEARNRAAERADADALIFLDVDCIPAPSLVESYRGGLRELDGLLMGGVRYLPPGRPRGGTWDWDELWQASRQHPDRPAPPAEGVDGTDRYELFWSLSFAVTRPVFDQLGGFDGSFDGYGGEDTDLAFTARARGVPLGWVGAWALHQHHDTYDPPLDHVADIVVNARRFKQKWGTWPMEGWLRQLDEMGIVRWSPSGDDLELVREATPDELDTAHRPTAVPSGGPVAVTRSR